MHTFTGFNPVKSMVRKDLIHFMAITNKPNNEVKLIDSNTFPPTITTAYSINDATTELSFPESVPGGNYYFYGFKVKGGYGGTNLVIRYDFVLDVKVELNHAVLTNDTASDPTGTWLVVTGSPKKSFAIANPANPFVAQSVAGASGERVLFSPRGSKWLLSMVNGVEVYDFPGMALIHTWTLGAGTNPINMVYLPNTDWVVFTKFSLTTIHVFNSNDLAYEEYGSTTLAFGNTPNELSVDPSTNYLYIPRSPGAPLPHNVWKFEVRCLLGEYLDSGT